MQQILLAVFHDLFIEHLTAPLSPPPTSSSLMGERWKPYALPAIIVAQFVVLLVQRPLVSGDDPVRVRMTIDIANGRLPIDHFSIILPMIAAPVYLLGRSIGHGKEFLEQFGLVVYVCWASFMTRRLHHLRGRRFAAYFLAAVYCSMLPAYVLGFNVELICALGTSAGLLAALTSKGAAGRWVGWLLVVVSVANLPAQLPGLAAMCIFLALRRRQWQILLVFVATVATITLESSWVTGHLTLSKYGSSGAISPLLPWGFVEDFGHPFVFGFVGIVFSLGRGIVFYIPTFPLSAVRPLNVLDQWCMALFLFVVTLIPAYSKWWAWYGGDVFGPRYFLIGVIPGAYAVCVRATNRGFGRSLAIITALWSAWVSVVGVVYYLTPRATAMCQTDAYRYEPLCWYSAEYSSLFAFLWDSTSLSFAQILFAASVAVTTFALIASWLRHDFRRPFGRIAEWLCIVPNARPTSAT